MTPTVFSGALTGLPIGQWIFYFYREVPVAAQHHRTKRAFLTSATELEEIAHHVKRTEEILQSYTQSRVPEIWFHKMITHLVLTHDVLH